MPQLVTLAENVDSRSGYQRAETNPATDRRRIPGDGGSQPGEAADARFAAWAKSRV